MQEENTYRKAHALFEEEQYGEALALYRSLAEHGSTEAQVFVGWMYQEGRGANKNIEEARSWYNKAASANSAEGQFYLGKLCLLEKKYDEAQRWFERASKQGYAPAIYHLGRMYQLGKGVAVDQKKAYEYLEQAAGMGHVFAQRVIAGKMLAGHFGVLKIPKGLYLLVKLLWSGYKVVHQDPYDSRIVT